jgi:CRP/FNR family cyclic AMP-dependent transcriptional regulator
MPIVDAPAYPNGRGKGFKNPSVRVRIPPPAHCDVAACDTARDTLASRPMADARREMLKAVPLFAGCDGKQLDFIASQVDEVDFAAGRELCREGSSGGEFFIIVSGTSEVRRQGRHLRELGPGDFFGEIALLDGGPRTATVTALTAMRCLVLSRGQFHNVIRQNTLIAVSVLETLGERLRALLGGQAT